MGGRTGQLTCCDRDCALANGCRMGGYECEGCGRWFCANEIDADGYCERCAEEREDGEEEDDGDGEK